MPTNQGSSELTAAYKGSDSLTAIYLGNNQIFPNTSAPTVTQSAFTSVTGASLTLNGNVTSDGGGTITERGFYFGTSTSQPSNTKYTVSGTIGAYTLNRTGLSLSTTYYSNAFATNSAGTTYSTQVSGTTAAFLTGSANNGSGADGYMYPSGGPNSFSSAGSWSPYVKPGFSHYIEWVQDRASGTFMGNFSPPSGYTMSSMSGTIVGGYGSASFSLSSTSISVTSTNNGLTYARVYFTLSS